ncbi:hypothetical protein Ae201684P_014527 [Aphanomyces euteiches]|nr:hypothetical protein Ae201684P_014527 [Aphanomyces euteiches]
MARISLMCVILGDGSQFVVDIRDDKLVAHLKNKIKKTKSSVVLCEADRLTLYAANMDKKWHKSVNRWLNGQDQTLTSLEHGGDTPREVLEIMDKDRKLKPTETIGALFTDTPTNGIIHVLVQLPQHTRKRSRPTSQVEISDFNNGDFDLGESPAKRKQVMPVATEQAQAFKYATLVGDCITSRHNVALPYPNGKVEKIFVRQCYRDIFDLFLDKIAGGRSFFGISGTLSGPSMSSTNAEKFASPMSARIRWTIAIAYVVAWHALYYMTMEEKSYEELMPLWKT